MPITLPVVVAYNPAKKPQGQQYRSPLTVDGLAKNQTTVKAVR